MVTLVSVEGSLGRRARKMIDALVALERFDSFDRWCGVVPVTPHQQLRPNAANLRCATVTAAVSQSPPWKYIRLQNIDGHVVQQESKTYQIKNASASSSFASVKPRSRTTSRTAETRGDSARQQTKAKGHQYCLNSTTHA
jgi:hypothetical protein